MVCTTAPIPGETKVWQYITLTRRIYLIDCPGVVPPNGKDSDTDILLRGVIRVQNAEYPSQYVESMLSRCQKRHVERTYGLKEWTDVDSFLEQLAKKQGKLLKGGEPDVDSVAKIVLNDFLRGRIPWYIPPPKHENPDQENAGIEGRVGRLGEMGRKRKRDDDQTTSVSIASSETRLDVQEVKTSESVVEIGSEDDEEDEEDDSDEAHEFLGFGDGLAIDPDAIGNLDSADDRDDTDESDVEGNSNQPDEK